MAFFLKLRRFSRTTLRRTAASVMMTSRQSWCPLSLSTGSRCSVSQAVSRQSARQSVRPRAGTAIELTYLATCCGDQPSSPTTVVHFQFTSAPRPSHRAHACALPEAAAVYSWRRSAVAKGRRGAGEAAEAAEAAGAAEAAEAGKQEAAERGGGALVSARRRGAGEW